MTDLANRLTDAQIDNIPTCGIVVIEADVREWRQLGGGGRLITFDYPKNRRVEPAPLERG
jgi:phosphohistidine phosphatase